MFSRVSALLLLSVAVRGADAGFFDDVSGVSKDVGNFFSTQFENAKDLFSNDQSELERNVERVKELLAGIKEKAKMLEPMANDAQKETLKNVDAFIDRVSAFQTEVKEEGAAKFEENKAKWQQMVTDIFDKGGLSSVTKMLGLQNSSSALQMLSVAVAPVFYMIFVR